MGCSAREKQIRGNRKLHSAKPDFDSSCNLNKKWMVPFKNHVELGLNPNSNPNVDSSGWVLCMEGQLEEILLKNIEIIYNNTVSKLVALGYNEDVAVKTILRNGHCYGGMDVSTNILQNSLACLNSGNFDNCGFNPAFSDLKQLTEYTLAGIVSLLQEVRPNLNRGDAMWCLLMSNFHVGRASTIQIPVGNECPSYAAVENTGIGNNAVGVNAPPLQKFHGESIEFPVNGFFSYGPGINFQLQRDIVFPKRFNLSPSMKSLLKRNVAMFAANFRANSKQLQPQAKAIPSISTISKLDSSSVSGTPVLGKQSVEFHPLNNQEDLNSVLSKLLDLNIGENSEFVVEDQKDEVIVTLAHQIKDLEKQVEEQKDWAHQKAIQAARKLSSDLIEVRKLKMEREANQRLKKGKEALDDTTMKRLSEMENALRRASGQMDQANAIVRKLEAENAEIRAELEASKLSASESVSACKQVMQREKKCLKRLQAWEKQKAKIQQNISDEKQKILEIEEELAQIKQCEKDAEVMGREELKAKEEALALIEEERRSKEAADTNNKRNLKALRLKIEIDFQRRKDDLLRLEQEISRLKASAHSADFHHRARTMPPNECEDVEPQNETIDELLQELDNAKDSSEKEGNGNRECIICGKDELSIIFLPCAHQIMCASCSEQYGRKAKAVCPCCRVPIEQRIRVFGASS
ncbi:MND1-interacting protein 1-like [Abrus precatorius]|uniref:MND1-interacting protein 1-like n=1 Tax=Abrus precatorius TaxID=3816 RepID=A0A8B8LYC9_ABRPR|nr:MND1-interacting protein 1-like [Abrus precatorius]